MTPFNNLIGLTITEVIRQDFEQSYDFYSPLGIYLRISDQEGVYLGVLNDSTSVNIELMNDEQLNEYCGVEYQESCLNELLEDDELNSLIGEQIVAIELAEYTDEEIAGDNFVVKQGKYAGIRIRTSSNQLTFYNAEACNLWLNMEVDIPNNNRWNWVKTSHNKM